MSTLKIFRTKNSISAQEGKVFDPLNTGDETCILCLRNCTSGQVVKFSTIPGSNIHDAIQCRLQLQSTLNLNLTLDMFVICRTCWKLVELVLEFQQCCLKAEMWTAAGFKNDADQQKPDTWLCEETFEMMTRAHLVIQERNEHILSEKRLLEKETAPLTIENVKVEMCDDDDDLLTEMVHNAEFRKISRNDPDVEKGETVVESSEAKKLDNNVIECNICHRKFDTEHGYKVHYKRCVGKNTNATFFKCSICTKSFKAQRELRAHMNRHRGVRPYQCRKNCENTFFSVATRVKHEDSCGSQMQVCPICGDQLKSRNTFANHMAHTHGEPHIGCDICGKKLKSKNKLRRHMLVHTNVRNYPCNVCGKSFKTSYAANVHQRIHTQEKPFMCDICSQGFTYKCSLKAHVNREHG
ncbi:zinc finger protein 32-like [Sabethes cyaneus]|uniref:zinc finger protein 32-like n=1 Tax=Sabethes cyaneus TaxID=53552 RepID=UPI00237DBC42|nr:zinc finger protein 32-like [Sabethes cyaneus]XP_053688474.1 zinc finger protein 32-like [Sabethes cyaneus]